MTSAPETVLWTMLTGVDAARDHIRGAAVESGSGPPPAKSAVSNIEIPFSLRKRRRAAGLTAAVWPSARGADAAWTAVPGPLKHEHLARIEETLPEGVMDYHGMEDAALRAGLSIEALSLGKRITGETLRVALPPGPIVISRLGHGEGQGIVKSYREEKKDRARFVPSSVGHRLALDPRNP